jgi:hypothetical protein
MWHASRTGEIISDTFVTVPLDFLGTSNELVSLRLQKFVPNAEADIKVS